ncbi:MAG: hypothetical protein JXQ72_04860 [Anaerolineae bacterium]|nr:hypothetical protein [Anaerolineae bacterium]
MDFNDFVTLDSHTVADLIPAPMGVAIPFNGTRRWYMAAFNKTADEVYTDDYLIQTFRRMLEIMGMMFADGVHTIYTPVIGRDLAERGPEYMQFGAQAVANVSSDEALAWYREREVEALCYGQIDLLPDNVQQTLQQLHPLPNPRHRLRYGVFADQPLLDIVAHANHLQEIYGDNLTADRIMTAYYGGPVAQVSLWIGSDQPTVFDVPLVIHGNTALYFLQFPTLYLDQHAWRRLLYDSLFIRGDQETLYPDNIATEKHITGLGQRRDGYWVPRTR